MWRVRSETAAPLFGRLHENAVLSGGSTGAKNSKLIASANIGRWCRMPAPRGTAGVTQAAGTPATARANGKRRNLRRKQAYACGRQGRGRRAVARTGSPLVGVRAPPDRLLTPDQVRLPRQRRHAQARRGVSARDRREGLLRALPPIPNRHTNAIYCGADRSELVARCCSCCCRCVNHPLGPA
jgi:hypothetical protein